MTIRFPAPLRPGDVVGVTSTSSGVSDQFQARTEFAIETVRARGYQVIVGDCMDGTSHISAPAADRAAELTRMLTDPAIRAVIPPWGGETAIDLLPLLDWDAIGAAEPTWYIGYSDNSTIMTPLTLRTGLATLHGSNLLDTPNDVLPPVLSWLDIAALPAGATFEQISPGVFRSERWADYVTQPEVTEIRYGGTGSWARLDDTEPVDLTGRLIGGCIETICHLAGTSYGDVGAFGSEHSDDGVIVYVEAAESDVFGVCRMLHGMRLAGFFAGAKAVLVGRTAAPDSSTLTQRDAVMDALGCLRIPVIADVECGHVPPFMPIVNGALGRVRFGAGLASLTQTLA